MIPKETFIVPLFDIIEKLNWIDTYQSMIIPNLATGFGTFYSTLILKLFQSLFVNLPK
ncbi:hypothetical protein N1495_01970 [Streptococcus didelphis]|nr:hypothetical protein N1495_01970 [Streptococcus didelphis]